MVELVKSTTPFPTRGDANVTLSVDRTRLSYDRTLMSWIRTATSLITFGFSIYKFFQIESERAAVPSTRLLGPREFGIMMIAIGLTSLLVATIEHSRDLSALKIQYPQTKFPRSTARLMAGLISLLGVSAIVAAVFRQ
jgi:putative membrane protein